MTGWKRYALIAGGAVLALVLAYGTGRYLAPSKTVTTTETKTEYKDRIQYVDRIHQVAGPVHQVVITKAVQVPASSTCPEHSETTTTTTTDSGPVLIDTNTQGQQSSEGGSSTVATKTVTHDRPRLRLELAQDVTRFTDPKQIGGAASVRVLGPVWLGVQVAKAEDWKHPRATLAMEF